MLEKFVASLVTTYLGRYVNNIDKDTLRLSLWQGHAELSNLVLRTSALDELNLPVTIARGHIGSIKLNIPWRKLAYESIRISIEDVYVHVVPMDATEFSQEDYEARLRERKMMALQVFEAKRTAAASSVGKDSAAGSSDLLQDDEIMQSLGDESDTQADAGFMDRLKRAIINNVEITIKNVRFVLEDAVTSKTHNVSANFSFSELHTSTIDPSTGEYAFVPFSVRVVHKTAVLSNLQVSLDISPKNEEDDHQDQQKSPRNLSLRDWMKQLERPFAHPLLTPTSVTCNIEYQPRLVDVTIPNVRITCNVCNPCLSLARQQYDYIWKFLRYIQKYPKLERYRVFRPKMAQTPLTHPRAWWNYAIQCVCSEVRDGLKRKTISWRCILDRSQKKTRYLELFKRSQEVAWMPKLTAEEQRELGLLEDSLEIDDIMYFRLVAYARLELEEAHYLVKQTQKELKQKKHVQESTATWKGWFKYYAGYSGTNEGEESSAWDIIDAKSWNNKQRAALYQSFGITPEDEGSTVAIASSADYVVVSFSLSVSKGSLQFVAWDNQSFSALTYHDFALSVDSKLQTFSARCTLGTYELQDHYTKTAVLRPAPHVRPATSVVETEDDDYYDACDEILETFVVAFSKTGASSYSLHCVIDPIEVALRVSFLQTVFGFWGVGTTSAFLDDFVQQNLSKSFCSTETPQPLLDLELLRVIENMWSVSTEIELKGVELQFLDADLDVSMKHTMIHSVEHSRSPTDWYNVHRVEVSSVRLGDLLTSPLTIEYGSLLVPNNMKLPRVKLTILADDVLHVNLSLVNCYRFRVFIAMLTEFISNMGGKGVQGVQSTDQTKKAGVVAEEEMEDVFCWVSGPVVSFHGNEIAKLESVKRRILFEERILSVFRTDRGSALYATLDFTNSDFELVSDNATKSIDVAIPQGGLKYDKDVEAKAPAALETLKECGIAIVDTTAGINLDDIRMQIKYSEAGSVTYVRKGELLECVDILEKWSVMKPPAWVRFRFDHSWQYTYVLQTFQRFCDSGMNNRWGSVRPDSFFGVIESFVPNKFMFQLLLMAPVVSVALENVERPDDPHVAKLHKAAITFDLRKFDKILSIQSDVFETRGVRAHCTSQEERFQLQFCDFHPLSPNYKDYICESRKQLRILIPTAIITLGVPFVTFVEGMWDALQVFMMRYEEYHYFEVTPYVSTPAAADAENLRYESFALFIQITNSSTVMLESETGPFASCTLDSGVISFVRRVSGEHETSVRLQGCGMTENLYPESKYPEILQNSQELNLSYTVRPKKMQRLMGYKYTHYLALNIEGGVAMYRQVFLWSLIEYFTSGVMTRLTFVSWRPSFDGTKFSGPIPFESFSRTAPKTQAGRDLLKLNVQIRNIDVVIPPNPLSPWAFTGNVAFMGVQSKLVIPQDDVLRSDIEIDLNGILMNSTEDNQTYTIMDRSNLGVVLKTEFVNPFKLIPEKTLMVHTDAMDVILTNVGLQRLCNMITGCIMEKWVPACPIPSLWPPSFTPLYLKDKSATEAPPVCFYEWDFQLRNVCIRGITLEGSNFTKFQNEITSSCIRLHFKWFTDTLFDTSYEINNLKIVDASVSPTIVNLFSIEEASQQRKFLFPNKETQTSKILAKYNWHAKQVKLGLEVDIDGVCLQPFPVTSIFRVKDFYVSEDVRNAAAPLFGWQTPPPKEKPPPIPGYTSTMHIKLGNIVVELNALDSCKLRGAEIQQWWKEESSLWTFKLQDVQLLGADKLILGGTTGVSQDLATVVYDSKKVQGEIRSILIYYSPEIVERITKVMADAEAQKLKYLGMYEKDRLEYLAGVAEIEERRLGETSPVSPSSPRTQPKINPDTILGFDLKIRHPTIKIEIQGMPDVTGIALDLGEMTFHNQIVSQSDALFEQMDFDVKEFTVGTYPKHLTVPPMVSRIDASLRYARCLEPIAPPGHSQQMIATNSTAISVDMSQTNYVSLLRAIAQYTAPDTTKATQSFDSSANSTNVVQNKDDTVTIVEDDDILQRMLTVAREARKKKRGFDSRELYNIRATMPELHIYINTSMSNVPTSQVHSVTRLQFSQFELKLVYTDSGDVDFRVQLQQAALVEHSHPLFSTQAEPDRGMSLQYNIRPAESEHYISIDLASSRIILEPNAFAPLWNYFYLQYCAVMHPHLGDAEVLEIDSDYTLKNNIVLSPNRVIKIRNTKANYIKLFGGLHAIHFLCARSHPMALIILDEGVTLHIVQTQLYLYRGELTDFIACGPGSYVIAEDTQNTFYTPKRADPNRRTLRVVSSKELVTTFQKTIIEAKGSLTAQIPGGAEGVSDHSNSIFLTVGLRGKYAFSKANQQLVEESGEFEMSNCTVTTQRGETEEFTYMLEPVSIVLNIDGNIRSEYTRQVAVRSTADVVWKIRYSDVELMVCAVNRLRSSLKGSEAKFALRRDIAAIESQELTSTTATTTTMLTEVFVTTCSLEIRYVGFQILDDRSGTDLPLIFVQLDNLCTPSFDITTLSQTIRMQLNISAEFFNQETCAWSVFVEKTKIDVGFKHEIPPTLDEIHKRRHGTMRLGLYLDPGINVNITPMMMRVMRRLRTLGKQLQVETVRSASGGKSQEFFMFALHNDCGLPLHIDVPQHDSIDLQHTETSRFNFKRGYELNSATQTITLVLSKERQIHVGIGQVGLQAYSIGSGRKLVVDVGLRDGQKRVVFRSSITINNTLGCALHVTGVGEIPPESEASVSFEAMDNGRFELRPVKHGYVYSSALLGVPYYIIPHMTEMRFACYCFPTLVVDHPTSVERPMYLEVSIESDHKKTTDTVIKISSLLTIVNKTGVSISMLLYDKVPMMTGKNKATGLRKLWTKTAEVLRPYVQVKLDNDDCYRVTDFEFDKEIWMDMEFTQPSGLRLKRSESHEPALIRVQEGSKHKLDKYVYLTDDYGGSLAVCIEYVKDRREIHVFCPYWIVNQTEHYIQVSDDKGRHLTGGQSHEEGVPPGGQPFLINPNSFLDADGAVHALSIRIGRVQGGQLDFAQWSRAVIPVYNVGDIGYVDSVMLESTGLCLSLGWSIEFAQQMDPAYTRVIKITPRWVVLNRTHRSIIVMQPNVGMHFDTLLPGTNVTIDSASTKYSNRIQITYANDSGESNSQHFSKPFSIEQPCETSINLKYRRLMTKPTQQHKALGHGGQQLFFDPEPDECESRAEFDVIRVTVYRRDSVLVVACDVIQKPPYCIENRTNFDIDVQQRNTDDIYPLRSRSSRGFVWEDSSKEPVMLIRVLLPGSESTGKDHHDDQDVVTRFEVNLTQPTSSAPHQQVRLQPMYGGGFLYLRIRAHQQVTYISITTDVHIDNLISLPFTNRHMSVRIEKVGASIQGRTGGVLYMFLKELTFTHSQGGVKESGRDMEQAVQFKMAHIQIDDERTVSKKPIVVVSHTTTVNESERWSHSLDLTIVRRLDRTTPHMSLRSFQFKLAPFTVHLDDGFLNDVLHCVKELSRTDLKRTKRRSAHHPPVYRATPWAEELKTPPPAESSVIWQVITVEHFQIDSVVLFLSLYRSVVGANDPFRNMLGVLSAILRTVKDVRFVWSAVRKERLSDKFWLLATFLRDYYSVEFLKQVVQILNIPGFSSLRNMMVELVDCYPTTAQENTATLHSYYELAGVVRPCRIGSWLTPPNANTSLTDSLTDSFVFVKRTSIGEATFSGALRSTPQANVKLEQVALNVFPRPAQRQLENCTLKNVRHGKSAVEYFVHVAPWEEMDLLFSPRDARMNQVDPRFSSSRFFDLADTLLVNYVRRNVCNPEIHNTMFDRCKRCDYVESLKKLRWVHNGYSTVLPIPGLMGTTDISWHEFVHHCTWLEFKNALRSEPDLFMEMAKAARDVVLLPSRNFMVLR
eukprot:PhF_6_TR38648/c0_g1_i1/m.57726/K19525/VPS13A_C; vacuolar protein sorting-associated protein 13A/C